MVAHRSRVLRLAGGSGSAGFSTALGGVLGLGAALAPRPTLIWAGAPPSPVECGPPCCVHAAAIDTTDQRSSAPPRCHASPSTLMLRKLRASRVLCQCVRDKLTRQTGSRLSRLSRLSPLGPCPGRSAIVVAARLPNVTSSDCVPDGFELGIGQRKLGARDVLFQVFDARGAGDGQHGRRAPEQPSERELRGRRMVFFCQRV